MGSLSACSFGSKPAAWSPSRRRGRWFISSALTTRHLRSSHCVLNVCEYWLCSLHCRSGIAVLSGCWLPKAVKSQPCQGSHTATGTRCSATGWLDCLRLPPSSANHRAASMAVTCLQLVGAGQCWSGDDSGAIAVLGMHSLSLMRLLLRTELETSAITLSPCSLYMLPVHRCLSLSTCTSLSVSLCVSLSTQPFGSPLLHLLVQATCCSKQL